ncbi:MAG: NADH-quinone oxidoreductase subunit NuoG [Thermoflexales bacterium]|nr:NADH-quinone oxidoreductase subunit NuoG [Thermoflexales bacterium]
MAINLIIDDQAISVPEGTLVVDAAKRAGITIPVFCYHPKLEPAGMCRMCLVEIGAPAVDRATGQPVLDEDGRQKIAWNPKLQTACTTPVAQGMQVRTQSQAVKDAQREVLEFLLTSHPLDCPICDKGGECPLQNLTLAYGPGQTRFEFLDKQLLDKHVPLGDLIWLDRERCIQCGRCIRFQADIAGEPVLGFDERGRHLEILTFSDPPFDSVFSGNTTDICPVGALTTVDFHFRARPWELTNVPSLCDHCAVGCNTTLGTRRSARDGGWDILRVMPRQNEQVNEIWICDKGRFGHGHARSPQRLTQPAVRWGDQHKPVSWEEALAIASEKLRALVADGPPTPPVAGLIGDRIPNEDAYVMAKFFRQVLRSDALFAYPPVSGAQVARQYGVAAGTNLGALDPSNSVVLVAGADLYEQVPLWYLRLRKRAKVFQVSASPALSQGDSASVRSQETGSRSFPASLNLNCRQGTETFVVLGLLNAVLSEGLVRADVAARVDGIADFKARLAQYTPAKVSELSGVPAGSIQQAARALAEAENAILIFGTLGAGEALPQHMANLAVLTDHVGRPNNGLLPAWPHANTQGVGDLLSVNGQLLMAPGQWQAASKQAPILYIVGADPVGDGEELPEEAFVICHELFLTATARRANLVLPALSWAERDGTFTNAERRVQRFYKALPPSGEAKADWEILQAIARKLDEAWNYATTAEIMDDLAANVPPYAGMSYARLARTGEQWPPVGRDNLYFGGTAYDNAGGLGAQLPAGCESAARYTLTWVEPETAAPKAQRLYRRGTLIGASSILKKHLVE